MFSFKKLVHSCAFQHKALRSEITKEGKESSKTDNRSLLGLLMSVSYMNRYRALEKSDLF